MNCTVAQSYVKCPVRPKLSNSLSESILICYWTMTASVGTDSVMLLARLTSSAELVLGESHCTAATQARQLPS